MGTLVAEPRHPDCVRSQALRHPWGGGGWWCLSGWPIRVPGAGLGCGSPGHAGSKARRAGCSAGHKPAMLPHCGEGVGGWAARTPWGWSGLRLCDARLTRGWPHRTGDAKCAGDRASSRSLWAVVSRCSQVAVSFTTLPFSVLTARGGERRPRHLNRLTPAPRATPRHSTRHRVPRRHPIPRYRLSTNCSIAKI